MDYEKKYNGALERAKNYYSTTDSVADTELIELIFPELKEKEMGEKIKRCLINGMKFYYEEDEKAVWGTEKFSMKVKDIIAWLEKQGEQKPNPYSGTSFEYNGHTWGMCARDGGAEVSMDGNLKAFISSDASFIYPDIPQPNLAPKSALEEFKEEKVDNANKVEQNLANSAKTCKKSQRMVSAEAKEALYDKPAWSEEDEKMLEGIVDAVKDVRCQSLLSEIEVYDDYIDWLKSLKQRIGG